MRNDRIRKHVQWTIASAKAGCRTRSKYITYHLVVDFVAAPMEAGIETLFQLIDFAIQTEPSLSI